MMPISPIYSSIFGLMEWHLWGCPPPPPPPPPITIFIYYVPLNHPCDGQRNFYYIPFSSFLQTLRSNYIIDMGWTIWGEIQFPRCNRQTNIFFQKKKTRPSCSCTNDFLKKGHFLRLFLHCSLVSYVEIISHTLINIRLGKEGKNYPK